MAGKRSQFIDGIHYTTTRNALRGLSSPRTIPYGGGARKGSPEARARAREQFGWRDDELDRLPPGELDDWFAMTCKDGSGEPAIGPLCPKCGKSTVRYGGCECKEEGERQRRAKPRDDKRPGGGGKPGPGDRPAAAPEIPAPEVRSIDQVAAEIARDLAPVVKSLIDPILVQLRRHRGMA